MIAACGDDGPSQSDIDANTSPADAVPDAPLPPFMDAVELALDTSSPPFNPAHLITADFNRDGKEDFAILERQFDRLLVILNATPTGAGRPTLGQQIEAPLLLNPIRIAAADLNGDSKPDLVVTYGTTDPKVSVFMNSTPTMGITPRFENRVEVDTTLDGEIPAFGDINGDGAPDLVVGSFGNTPTPGKVTILLDTTAHGATAATFGSKVELTAGFGVNAIAIADFDDDGKQDIAVTNVVSDRVSVLRNTTTNASTPTFAPPIEVPTAMGPSGIVAVDLDLDGRRDLAVTARDANMVSRLINTTTASGSIAFATPTDRPVGGWPSSIAAGVHDRAQHHGHGEHHGFLPFIAAANDARDAITVLYGVSLSRYYDIPLTASARHVVVADFNNDGKDDVAAIASSAALTIALAR